MRKAGEVNDYIVHEVAKVRIEELREEAARARVAREVRERAGRGLGLIGGWWARQVAGGGSATGEMKEVCCA
ncbi:MAG TPA: hypothetical protein VK869_09785 [Rubrobacteraceae bacterium]|nr:hypothetical protein [Rubrobacteraceae bacterium]